MILILAFMLSTAKASTPKTSMVPKKPSVVTYMWKEATADDTSEGCVAVKKKADGVTIKVPVAAENCKTMPTKFVKQSSPFFAEGKAGCYEVDAKTSGKLYRFPAPDESCDD